MDHAANGNEKWHLLTHSFNNICRYCVVCVKCHLAQQNLINLSSLHQTFCSAHRVRWGTSSVAVLGWRIFHSSCFNSLAVVRPGSRWTPTGSLATLQFHPPTFQFPNGRGVAQSSLWFPEELRISCNQALMGEIGFSFPWLFHSREPSCLKWS